MESVEFIPPHHFPPLDPGEMYNSEREAWMADAKFSLSTGYPYDVIEDIPTNSGGTIPTTTKARGGAVHFAGLGPPGETYPAIDRGFFFEVDDTSITTKSFWDVASTDYLQSQVKRGEVGLWGYNNSGSRNFALLASDSGHSASMRVYTQGADKYAAVTVDNSASELYGYTANGAQWFKLHADGSGTMLSLGKPNRGVEISPDELKAFRSSGAYGSLLSEGSLYLQNDHGDKITLDLSGNGNAYGRFETTDGYKAVVNSNLFSVDDGNGKQIQITVDGSGPYLEIKDAQSNKTVNIDIPSNSNGNLVSAQWVEIDVCQNGQAKKMKVLATEPYSASA